VHWRVTVGRGGCGAYRGVFALCGCHTLNVCLFVWDGCGYLLCMEKKEDTHTHFLEGRGTLWGFMWNSQWERKMSRGGWENH
jgi:hypothetical protein